MSSVELSAKIAKLRDEGLTNDIIAQRLGMNVATVAQRYKRYKEKLNGKQGKT